MNQSPEAILAEQRATGGLSGPWGWLDFLKDVVGITDMPAGGVRRTGYFNNDEGSFFEFTPEEASIVFRYTEDGTTTDRVIVKMWVEKRQWKGV